MSTDTPFDFNNVRLNALKMYLFMLTNVVNKWNLIVKVTVTIRFVIQSW